MSREPAVLIVGAGPAGATAARTLARAGVRVQLLDRHAFPRNKPCGGAISMRALGRFPYLSDALARIATHPISRLHLESPNGESASIASATPAALMIRRVEFDGLLVSLAVEAGAQLIERAAVTQVAVDPAELCVSTQDGRSFRAPFLIAADGVNSVVARRLGFTRGWSPESVALDLMEECPTEALRSTDPETLWVAYGYKGAHGYAYVFPKHAHVNVGVGYALSYFRRELDALPYELQQGLVSSLCGEAVLEGRSSRQYFTPYLLPIGGALPVTGQGRVLLVGDAAGFVNGFTAEGIYYAMVTGELAGQAVLATLGAVGSSSGPREARRAYARAWKREIGPELRDSVMVQRYLFRDVRRIDAMVSGALQHADVTRMLVAVAAGEVSYQEARRHLLRRLPGVALKVAVSGLLAGAAGLKPSRFWNGSTAKVAGSARRSPAAP